MNEKSRMLRGQLDEAVDRMDLAEIDRALDRLGPLPEAAAPEDPEQFAERILTMDRERDRAMNKMHGTGRTVLAAAAVAAVLSVGVYAAGNWQRFAFVDGGHMVTVAGGASLTEEEAKKLAEAPQVYVRSPDSAELAMPGVSGLKISPEEARITFERDPDAPEDVTVTQRGNETFETPQKAAEKTGVPVSLPGKLPEGMEPESVSADSAGKYFKTVWTNYSGGGRRLGVTVQWTRIGEDVTVVDYHGIEEGSSGTCKTAKGYEFTTVREDGSDIATIFLGEYEYTLVFDGFSRQERQAVLDSVDLSAYA